MDKITLTRPEAEAMLRMIQEHMQAQIILWNSIGAGIAAQLNAAKDKAAEPAKEKTS